MARPKGIIKSGVNAGGLAKAALGSIPVVGGVASELFSQLTAQGVPAARALSMSGMSRRRHKGLTYREIRGAVKVLKLVKRFAPAGHKTALKVKRGR